MIYNSLLFVYDKNVKYQQQTDFKYLNNMHCKNMAIYASKKKKKKKTGTLYLLKLMAALWLSQA